MYKIFKIKLVKKPITFLVLLFVFVAIEVKHNDNVISTNISEEKIPSTWEFNKVIESEVCSLSGHRKKNVVTDIGYGDREYYSLTNDYSQVIEVYAQKLQLQNEEQEELKGGNRYCSYEAEVPGTETDDLDEGHIIADSLGGVSNAYNITPQNSIQNRSGEQAKMEKDIRKALYDGKEVTEFHAIISYESNYTQTPNQYIYEYKKNGKPYSVAFYNENNGGGE